MLDAVTIDQLRMLIAVAETGTFSGAARKVQRVQSAVSSAMANLEAQLGVAIWDRSTKVPALTEQGQGILARAKRVVSEMDALRSFSASLSSGVEAKVSLCIDSLFPIDALADACAEFALTFPTVDLRVDTQTMSSVADRVLDRSATVGVVSGGGVRAGLESRALAASVTMVPVVVAEHALAAHEGPLPTATLAEHVQIVLSQRSEGSEGNVPDRGVLSPRTWRVADLATKHALLLRGLGWGNLPDQLAAADLAKGDLVRIRPEAWSADEHTLHFHVVHRTEQPLGPAHRWLVGTLERRCTTPPLTKLS